MHSGARSALSLILFAASSVAFQPLTLAPYGTRQSQHRVLPSQRSNAYVLGPGFRSRRSLIDDVVTQRLQSLSFAPRKSAKLPQTVSEAAILDRPAIITEFPSLALRLTKKSWLAILCGIAVLAASIPAASVVAVSSLAGAMGGFATVAVARDDEAFGGYHIAEEFAATAFLKAVICGSYSAFFAAASQTAFATLGHVALAAVGTGLLMGLCQHAIQQARTVGDRPSLRERLGAVASAGLLSQEGLLGRLEALNMLNTIMQYEVFFLTFTVLASTFPWMDISIFGAAVAGAISGTVTKVAAQALSAMQHLSARSWSVRPWFARFKRGGMLLNLNGRTTLEFGVTAVKSAVMFAVYKAVCNAFAPIPIIAV